LERCAKNANERRIHNHPAVSKRSRAKTSKRKDGAAKLLSIFDELLKQYKAREIESALQDEIKTLIDQGVEVDARNDEGTPLLVLVVNAALRCTGRTDDKGVGIIEPYKNIICQLIDNGANPNTNDRAGGTPLILAIEYPRGVIPFGTDDEEALMKLLIENGAHVEQQHMSFKGERTWPTTPLIAASRRLRHSVVKLLLTKSVNVNTEASGETALYATANPGYEIYPVRVPAISTGFSNMEQMPKEMREGY
jgi:ankyrin repeat protein